MDYDKARRFLEKLERPTVVYHKDSDGVCSSAVLQELVSCAVLPNDGPGIQLSEGLVESLKDSESVVFLDIPVDQLSVVEELGGKKVFILDHHPPERDLTSERVMHMNPRFDDPDAYLPASYLSYRLADEKTENVAWKAGVGVIGDHGVEDCKDLFEVIRDENPEAIGDRSLTYEDLKSSKLGLIADMIEASKAVKGIEGLKRAQKIIKEAGAPNEVFETELKDFHEVYQKELDREVENFGGDSEYFPETNSYLYEVQSNYSIGSDLSTKLSNKNPEAVVIVYQKESYGMKISGRCQSGREDVSKIIRESVGEYGSGGGHPQAAGGFVERGKEDFVLERFRERLEGIS